MDNFVAIDFETANFAQSSVCSVGLVIVKDGEIVDNYYSLIRPIPNYYNARCSEVNGLHFDDTNGAPEFPDVWSEAVRKVHEYFPYIEDGEVPLARPTDERRTLQAVPELREGGIGKRKETVSGLFSLGLGVSYSNSLYLAGN